MFLAEYINNLLTLDRVLFSCRHRWHKNNNNKFYYITLLTKVKSITSITTARNSQSFCCEVDFTSNFIILDFTSSLPLLLLLLAFFSHIESAYNPHTSIQFKVDTITELGNYSGQYSQNGGIIINRSDTSFCSRRDGKFRSFY